MDLKYFYNLARKNLLFWVSRKIDYPLCPPDMVQVNFTFRCNLRCKMCSMHEQMNRLKGEGRQIEIDSVTFGKLIKETKEMGVDNILFIGGEPFLRKDLFELISFARSLGLNTIIVTNGVLLNEDNIRKCIDSGVDWLSISLDAASEASFSRIRGEKVFGKITDNIDRLNLIKKELSKEFPKIVSVCTIMDENLEELLDVVELCKKENIERVIFQPVVINNIDQTKRGDESAPLIRRERLTALDSSIDKLIAYKKKSPENYALIANDFKNLNMIKRYFRGKASIRQRPCYAGYNRLQIVQEGKVYFCVSQDEYVANFGDVKKDSLKDLWFSKEAKKYRKLIKKCKSPCLQWCSYRDAFIEFRDIFVKRRLFSKKH
ncbi:MAG: radical SAM protein [Candidatus Omnitrophica bacterium]|nr:radical SAM protein [Candidatus Omnitrophota bacterium]MBD3268578.1 radical SAM protein [Candidatus Omnitrophota bacterium]